MIKKLIELDLTEIIDIEFSKVLNRSSLLEGKGIEKILKIL